MDLLHHRVKIIHDCCTTILELIVDDTVVIMFMIPLNGMLKTEQSLVIQTKKQDVQRATIEVTAQYKIVNTLVTYDNNEL